MKLTDKALRELLRNAPSRVAYYSYDPDEGYETYSTADAARLSAEESLENALDDHWHENTELIEWGMLIAVGEIRETETVHADAESDDERAQMAAANGWSTWTKYDLVPASSAGDQLYGMAPALAAEVLRLRKVERAARRWVNNGESARAQELFDALYEALSVKARGKAGKSGGG